MTGKHSILGFIRCALLLTFCLCAAVARADPPGRIGRLSAVEGDISLYDRDSGDWQPLPANWPLTGGDTLWTGPGSRADIRIGSTVVRLDGSTELAFIRLDDEAIAVRLQQGSLALRIDDPVAAQQFRFESELGHTGLIEPGRYRFDAGDFTTTATVYRGQLGFEGNGQAYVVMSGQRAEFWYSGSLDMRVSDARRDGFFDWVMARDQFEDRWRRPRYVSANMTGYEDLDLYGDWHDSDDYGEVWTPRLVPIGWSPYRRGRWALIAPWGWTWIDEAPWGFAPFHYGRWVMWRGSWAWVPGNFDPNPTYAPALVAWIGQPGTSPLMLGGRAGVGWFPLGPREPYVPPYHASDRYLRDINRPYHAEHWHGDGASNDYVNRRLPQAITVVPIGVMTGGRNVGRAFDGHVDIHAIAQLPVSRDAPLHLQAPAPADNRDDGKGTRSRPAEPPTTARPRHDGANRQIERPHPASQALAPAVPNPPKAKREGAKESHPVPHAEAKLKPAANIAPHERPHDKAVVPPKPQEHPRDAPRPDLHGREVNHERHRETPRQAAETK